MFIAHISTKTGPMSIAMSDLPADQVSTAFSALMSVMLQVDDPIELTSSEVPMMETTEGAPADLRFRYLGPQAASFETQEAFAQSMNDAFQIRLFQCPREFDMDKAGRITTVFECFELIEGGPPATH